MVLFVVSILNAVHVVRTSMTALGSRALDERSIVATHSTIAGYDPQANGMAEACVGVMARGCRSLLPQAVAPRALWVGAITFISELRLYLAAIHPSHSTKSSVIAWPSKQSVLLS